MEPLLLLNINNKSYIIYHMMLLPITSNDHYFQSVYFLKTIMSKRCICLTADNSFKINLQRSMRLTCGPLAIDIMMVEKMWRNYVTRRR